MSSFSQLFKNSKLAKFDPALSQVYKTYGEYQRRGDYGVKRNLPNHLRTNVVTIGTIDTMEHQTPFKTAETLIRFTRKWKENFLISKSVEPLKSNKSNAINKKKLKNIAKMSKKEFEKLLKRVEERKDEWDKKLLTDSNVDPENWLEFLGLTFDTRNSVSTVKGLTYSHNNPGVNFQIQGRILNRDANGVFAVGISGLVGSLHFGKAQRLAQVNRRKLDNFYIEKAEFDEQGRPNVRISHTPLLTSKDGLSILDNLPGRASLFFDSATNRVKDDEKTQEEIISKLKSLLETTPPSSSEVISPPKSGFQRAYEEMFSKDRKIEDNFSTILQKNKVKNDESSLEMKSKGKLSSKFQTADELFKDLLDDKSD
ncbi:10917_t:CDS:1 [Funneliformis geosporum]|uniref:1025_t:CDS:1 n=1 Tax=Funneliformis geosporum TaxID=1117311 RepID=A0A9W4SCA3_9GLOM|nr:1025_t:CDS:1 [Funneliformis geosporum]CAI2163497.1 10917_t:CDS:1 [Funneliformis geosporum]